MENFYCSKCNNIYDIIDDIGTKCDNLPENDKTNDILIKEPYFYCPNCSHYEKIKPGTSLVIKNGIEQNIYIQHHTEQQIKNKKINNSLMRTKNYICPNKDCPTHKDPKLKEAIMEHITHNSFIVKYICCVCNNEWINRN
jgi:hypothetical protein